jgi:hypothetical protein
MLRLSFSLGQSKYCTLMIMNEYKIVNGTFFDPRTPDEVIRILESARQNRTRLHIRLGETTGPNVGKDWLEEFDTYGYIGRSTGSVKVPLLVPNRSSIGGGAILDHCIVRIRESAGGRVLYQHPSYHHCTLEIRPKSEFVTLPDGRTLKVDVLRDGQIHASFENVEQARRWIHMLGVTASISA